MNKYNKLISSSLPKMNKKGQMGLDLAQSVLIALVIIVVTAVGGLLALNSLATSNIFTGSAASTLAAANATNNLVGNYSSGVSSFGAAISTIIAILVVIIVVSGIAILLIVLNRAGSRSGGGTGL